MAAEARSLDEKVTLQHQLGSAELISGHRQRVVDVIPHGDEVDKKTSIFRSGQDKVPLTNVRY